MKRPWPPGYGRASSCLLLDICSRASVFLCSLWNSLAPYCLLELGSGYGYGRQRDCASTIAPLCIHGGLTISFLSVQPEGMPLGSGWEWHAMVGELEPEVSGRVKVHKASRGPALRLAKEVMQMKYPSQMGEWKMGCGVGAGVGPSYRGFLPSSSRACTLKEHHRHGNFRQLTSPNQVVYSSIKHADRLRRQTAVLQLKYLESIETLTILHWRFLSSLE